MSEAASHWIELDFVVGQSHADELSDLLIEEGALSVQVLDDDAGTVQEKPVFGEPGMPAAPLGWRASRIVILCETEQAGRASIQAALARLQLPMPETIGQRQVEHQDWVSLTQAQFEPMAIGERLWITPSWHLHDPDSQAGGAGREVILLDPGMAFGTGSHPTTRLCLGWLDRHLPPGASVIDYGCGSGILAIAAARLGAGTVHGVDIDEQAIESARINAGNNQVELRLSTTREPAPSPARIVLANILASPLKVLAPLLEDLVEPGGQLVLAGLLDEQVDDVAACYRRIPLKVWASEDGWSCLAGTAPESGWCTLAR